MLLKGAVNNILPLLSLFIDFEIKDKRFQGGEGSGLRAWQIYRLLLNHCKRTKHKIKTDW